jgi:hypothetical protein
MNKLLLTFGRINLARNKFQWVNHRNEFSAYITVVYFLKDWATIALSKAIVFHSYWLKIIWFALII